MRVTDAGLGSVDNDDTALLLEATRRFLRSETTTAHVRTWAETPDGFDRGWWATAAELGWTSLAGGHWTAGVETALAAVAFELGWAVAPGPFIPCNLVAAAVAGSPVHESLLADVAGGAAVATWCVAEPGRPWGLDMTTTLTWSGDGYRLNGVKTLVEAAPQADHFLVTAHSADGPVHVVVPAGVRGVEVRPLNGLDLVRRYGEVRFADVVVPAEALVGSGHEGASVFERLVQLALVVQSAEMVGCADRLFTMTVDYATERHSFGRPLVSYQALKHRFADMKMALEASRATTEAAARGVEAGDEAAGKLARVAKVYVGDHAPEIAQECVQLHGAIGVTWEHDIHLYMRRIMVDRGMYGRPDEHRRWIGARAVAGRT